MAMQTGLLIIRKTARFFFVSFAGQKMSSVKFARVKRTIRI